MNEIIVATKETDYIEAKIDAEIGYCNIALLKAGIGISEELKGLAEIGRKHIEKYENELLKNKERFQGQYIE